MVHLAGHCPALSFVGISFINYICYNYKHQGGVLLAEYDLIIKALAERYMDKIASFVRGVPVAVEQIEYKDK